MAATVKVVCTGHILIEPWTNRTQAVERYLSPKGGGTPLTIWNIALTGFGMFAQGIKPVSISTTVQPTLHTSARCKCPGRSWFLMTSGAIQLGLPMRPQTMPSGSMGLLMQKPVSFTAPALERSTLLPCKRRRVKDKVVKWLWEEGLLWWL